MDQQVLRVGRVSAINYASGAARVTYDDRAGATTVEMPYLAWAYWMPKVGDMVLVGHLSNGASRAVILGPLWYDGHRPHHGRKGLYRQEYTNSIGGDAAEYDKAANSLTITAGGCTIKLQDGHVTVTAPAGVSVSDTMTVATDTTIAGISFVAHTHTGVHGETTPPH